MDVVTKGTKEENDVDKGHRSPRIDCPRGKLSGLIRLSQDLEIWTAEFELEAERCPSEVKAWIETCGDEIDQRSGIV